MPEAVEEKEIPSALCLPAFKQGDEFLFSLSEFVKPALTIRFLRAKQGYMLFEYPSNITGQLRLDMRLYFVAHLEKHEATISFSGQVYRIFKESQLGFPALIVKAPSFFTYRQERRRDPRIVSNVPCRWWRSGSFKQGVVENLSIGGVRFNSVDAAGLNIGDEVFIELQVANLALSGPLKARVLRVDKRPRGVPTVIGAEFIALESHDKKALDVFINDSLLNE